MRTGADAEAGKTVVPVFERIFCDHLTPISAYRSLVREDDREAPSFLLESVHNGENQGRYSFVGAQPALEILATGSDLTVLDHLNGTREERVEADPLAVPEAIAEGWVVGAVPGLPETFSGGWVGYCGYDTVRYVYQEKLPFEDAPQDDRRLPDMHLGLYNNVVVFDHAQKLCYAVSWVHVGEHASVDAAFAHGHAQVDRLIKCLGEPNPLAGSMANRVTMALEERSPNAQVSNMAKEDFLAAVETTKEHIQAGDIFQLVLSHRFERRTFADPFEVYRSLRVVNPSPYMIYLQARGSIVVASSPEILCRVDRDREVTNRPLAGTRKRGEDPEADAALEADLLSDEKERSEHVMLVDLGRNDVGIVSKNGSVQVRSMFDIERYSHVMHISSTVTGDLKDELTAWDALRAALPVGTISGAPKVRAMQIIDELEVSRRGPYGGGVGYVAFNGQLDMALALRTMVIPSSNQGTLYSYADSSTATGGGEASEGRDGYPRREWTVHLQAGAGVVADSVPESEYEETVNKAAALGRAVDLAEESFL